MYNKVLSVIAVIEVKFLLSFLKSLLSNHLKTFIQRHSSLHHYQRHKKFVKSQINFCVSFWRDGRRIIKRSLFCRWAFPFLAVKEVLMIFELQYSKLCLLASNTGGIKPRRVPDKEAKMLALVINKSTSPDLYIVLVQTLWLVKMYEELFFQTKKGWVLTGGHSNFLTMRAW